MASALAPARERRSREARATEAGWIASVAQRWSVAPPALGGPAAAGFRDVTFDALGLAADARGVRRTAVGVYRLIPVAPCETLDGCARLVGCERPAEGGLIVLGAGGTPDDAVAVLVLGPLVLVPLPTVPWAWIRTLTTPATDPLAPRVPDEAPTPEPEAQPASEPRPLHLRPQRERRMPSWRSPKPTTRRRDALRAADRTAV